MRRLAGLVLIVMVSPFAVVISAATAQVAACPTSSSAAQSAVPCDSSFVPLTPARVYDSRADDGKLGHKRALRVKMANRAGVPSEGVVAVALNVTAIRPTRATYLTVWPTGTTRPVASSLNLDAGARLAGFVVARLGKHGEVNVANYAGRTHVIVDVAGYYVLPTRAGLLYHAAKPRRLFDSRTEKDGRLNRSDPSRTLTIPQLAGVPSDRMRAAVINVTAVGAKGRGHLMAYSAGTSYPHASSLSFSRGGAVANRAVTKLSSGSFKITMRGKGVHVVVDIVGWYARPKVAGGSAYSPLSPSRGLDTRAGIGGPVGALGPNSQMRLDLAGDGKPLPLGASAVVMTLTSTKATSSTYLTAWASGNPRPGTSDLNVVAGKETANLVVVPLGSDGAVNLFNHSGSTHVVADIVGYYRRVAAAAAIAPPANPTPTPTPTPGYTKKFSIDVAPGTFWWGSSVQGNGDPGSLESDLGTTLSARRTYFYWPAGKAQVVRTLNEDKAAGRLSTLAVKFGDWASVASGAQDAELRDFAATVKAVGIPVVVTPHHEPEGGGTGGTPDGPAADYRAMVAHALPILKTAPNLSVGICLMAYTFQPNSGRSPNDWWVPGVDFLGVDGYNYWGTNATAKWRTPADIFTDPADFAASKGVRMMVLETGVQATDGVAGAPGSSYQWMHDLRAFLMARNALGATYFNSALNSVAPWTLSGERLRAFREILNGPSVARPTG